MMVKISLKFVVLFGIALYLLLALEPALAQEQWPPFNLKLIPSYQNNKITYNISISSKVEWNITNLTIKIGLPPGTKFLEAQAQDAIETQFDGKDITFFTAAFLTPIKDASFTVEITEPATKVFTTHAWIGWQGDQPGDYLAKDVSVDVSKQPLNWEPPGKSRLLLQARAMAGDNVVTYMIYPKNIGQASVRMQDLKINVPIPEEATYLSAEAPPAFTANFDGREVSFFTLELAEGVDIGPLTIKISTEGVTAPTITTHAWASWKNAGKKVGVTTVVQEETVTGDLVVQPHASQWVVADAEGDVPHSNYDLRSMATQAVTLPTGEEALKVTFNVAKEIGQPGQPLEFNFYIDQDCQPDTGKKQSFLGAEHRIKYSHVNGRAVMKPWDEKTQAWQQSEKLQSQVTADTVAIWVPYSLLENGRKFCWIAVTDNQTTEFYPEPPADKAPNSNEFGFANYEALDADVETDLPVTTSASQRVSGAYINETTVWQYLPGWSEMPANWQGLDFDDSQWFMGTTRLGFGKGQFNTDLSLLTPQSESPISIPAPGDKVLSVFLRTTFNVDDPALLTKLRLRIRYQDGFVAYLNGVEVARRGLGEPNSPLSFETPAVAKANKTEDFDLNDFISKLVTGDNVLAIQAHRTAKSNTLAVLPKLNWTGKSSITNQPESNQENGSPESSNPTPKLADIQGKLAISLDSYNIYNVHIFSMPDGKDLATIPNARQPNFRFDGQRLLINREGGGQENLYEYNVADGTEQVVSDAPQDRHPFYDVAGNRVVYGNPELTVGQPEKVYNVEEEKYYFTGVRKPFIFVQCGLLPPHQETEPRCRDIPNLGVLVPAGQVGEIQGTHPVWTSNDMIAFKGCNTWAGSRLCGIFIVPSASTKGFSDGFIPRQLTRDTSDIPADTKGNLITFTSKRDGNWEAYVMDLNGQGVKNLSNSPDSNDGLPTLSPDGSWVAFVSDRDGGWAVWATPVVGGTAEKLFALPAVPWGSEDRDWTNERISWAP
jgi:hypothetical protein